jgi:hypothetical protein
MKICISVCHEILFLKEIRIFSFRMGVYRTIITHLYVAFDITNKLLLKICKSRSLDLNLCHFFCFWKIINEMQSKNFEYSDNPKCTLKGIITRL